MRGNKPGKHRVDQTTEQLLRELDLMQATEPVPDIEPPRMIDQAVRNMARRAPADTPAIPEAGSLRWIAGLSTLSLALIALGISLVQSPLLPAPETPAFKTELQEPRADSRFESDGLARTTSNGNFARKAASKVVANETTANSFVEKDSTPAAYKLRQQAAETSATRAPQELMAAPANSEERIAQNTEPAVAGPTSAEAWLDLIHQLNEQGLQADAKEQLRAFRADYPDYPLPDWAAELQP